MPNETGDLAEEVEIQPIDAFLSVLQSKPGSPDVSESFRRVFDSWSSAALRIARLHGSPADADDAVQEAFIKLWSAANGGTLKSMGDGGNPKAWFFTTVTNEARGLAKKRAGEMKRQERLGEETKELLRLGYDPTAQYLYMDKLVGSPEYGSLLRAAFETLSDDEKALVQARYGMHQSYAEMAEIRHESDASLRQKLRRIRLRLKEQMQATASADEESPH